METPYSEKLADFPSMHVEMGGSAPFGQARLARPNWPQCAKSHAAWHSLSQGLQIAGILKKIFFHFLPFLILGVFFCFRAVGPI